MGEVVAAQQPDHIGHRIGPFHGHHSRSLGSERGMDAQGHVHLRAVEQLTYPFGAPYRRNGDALRAPCQSPWRRQYVDGADHGLKVVGRLAHPHEYHVGQLGRLVDREYLVDDLCGRQIAVESLPPGHAEGAVHAASGLRADAERRPVAVRYHHCLHVAVGRAAEEILHRPVGRRHPLQGVFAACAVALGQHGPRPFREICHPVDGRHAFLIEPVGHLSGGVARHPAVLGDGFQFGGVHSNEWDQGFHDAKLSIFSNTDWRL